MAKVSHATRPFGSSLRIASSTASEIWSATLSGWPSVTDSLVKSRRYAIVLRPLAPGCHVLDLLGRERIDVDVHRCELEFGDLFVDVLGNVVDFLFERPVILGQVCRR